MNKLKITCEKVELIERFTGGYKVTVPDGESVCNITTRDMERSYGNGAVITDAINTYNECGLLSSELLQQNDELKEALAGAIFVLKQENIKDASFYQDILTKYQTNGNIF